MQACGAGHNSLARQAQVASVAHEGGGRTHAKVVRPMRDILSRQISSAAQAGKQADVFVSLVLTSFADARLPLSQDTSGPVDANSPRRMIGANKLGPRIATVSPASEDENQ